MAMSDPDVSKVSIGAPRSRIDRAKDAGLTRGLYQGSRTIRRVRGCLRISESPRTIGRLVQPQLERDLFLTRRGRQVHGEDGESEATAASIHVASPLLTAPGKRLARTPRHDTPCVLFRSRARCIASGLLHWAAGVITDFSASNAVLGCIRLPTYPTRAPVVCRAGQGGGHR